jgi:hypothetical protein
MNKSAVLSHESHINASRQKARLTVFPAARGTKGAAKPSVIDQGLVWESAFHADRGCLSCALPPRGSPRPQH